MLFVIRVEYWWYLCRFRLHFQLEFLVYDCAGSSHTQWVHTSLSNILILNENCLWDSQVPNHLLCIYILTNYSHACLLSWWLNTRKIRYWNLLYHKRDRGVWPRNCANRAVDQLVRVRTLFHIFRFNKLGSITNLSSQAWIWQTNWWPLCCVSWWQDTVIDELLNIR